jgi:hypothetical protein
MNVKQQWIRLSLHLPMKNYISLEAICCLCFMIKVLTYNLKLLTVQCPVTNKSVRIILKYGM